MLYNVPILELADMEDADRLLQSNQYLANAVAFVTARFVPGCNSVRTGLAPGIIQFLRSTARSSQESDDQVWARLQAFAVIYAYRQVGEVPKEQSLADYDDHLNQWSLKSSIETFALRVSLHRSMGEVMTLIRNGHPEITRTPSYRRYVYWLWLFTMAHHHSLVTRTPPSIREDTTTRVATDLLKDLDNDSRVLRILAEVDLCMLWGQAGRLKPGLGEWWCPSDEEMDSEETFNVLEDADRALDLWSQRWGLSPSSHPSLTGSTPEARGAPKFHYLFTRFCLRTFGTRTIHQQMISSQGHASGRTASTITNDAPALVSSVLKSAAAAAQCCDFLLELSPLQKDGSRYIADFGFSMVAFCCLYIIRAYELFGGKESALTTALDSVEQVASLMEGLSVGYNHCPAAYGRWLLARLDKVTPQHPVAGHLSIDSQLAFPPFAPNLSSPKQLSSTSNSITPVATSEHPFQPGPGTTLHHPGSDMESQDALFYPAHPVDWAGRTELGLSHEDMLDSDFIFDPSWNLSTLTPF